jgi:hypothetical protein
MAVVYYTMKPSDQGLLFSDLASAQARSAQMATSMGCDGVNSKFWYVTVGLTDGRGALIVESTRSAYGTKPGPTALTQLTPAEISALQPSSVVIPLLPVSTFVLSTAGT